MFPVPRIAVVGSYAAGLTMNVPRLPALGEMQLGSGYRFELGGKGYNQAVGCARLGAKVQFVARVGTDAFGDGARRSTLRRFSESIRYHQRAPNCRAPVPLT